MRARALTAVRFAAAVVAVLVMCAQAYAGSAAPTAPKASAADVEDGLQRRGGQLFRGDPPLPGRITGHALALPANAARCMNCHGVDATPTGSTSIAFGPALTHGWLTAAVSRRKGPPSRYDASAFCKVVRTGVDPAFIVVAQTMPRYEVDDRDCRALWAYLTRGR